MSLFGSSIFFFSRAIAILDQNVSLVKKERLAVYKENKVKNIMVHFFPILQIRFIAFVIRKHEKTFI
jgi:hypothetical protein